MVVAIEHVSGTGTGFVLAGPVISRNHQPPFVGAVAKLNPHAGTDRIEPPLGPFDLFRDVNRI